MTPTLGHVPDHPYPFAGERVYLAARFGRRNELRQVAHEIAHLGATVVSAWLDVPEPLAASDVQTPSADVEDLAASDLRDVSSATTLIAFTEAPSSTQGRGGRHVELGVALALGQRVILIGPREHIFHCLPQVDQFDSWAAAKEALLRPRAAAAV